MGHSTRHWFSDCCVSLTTNKVEVHQKPSHLQFPRLVLYALTSSLLSAGCTLQNHSSNPDSSVCPGPSLRLESATCLRPPSLPPSLPPLIHTLPLPHSPLQTLVKRIGAAKLELNLQMIYRTQPIAMVQCTPLYIRGSVGRGAPVSNQSLRTYFPRGAPCKLTPSIHRWGRGGGEVFFCAKSGILPPLKNEVYY